MWKPVIVVLFLGLLLAAPLHATSFSSTTAAAGTEWTSCPAENRVSAVVAATSGANTSGIAAQGAGNRTYIEQVIVYNNGASNGAMLITDGSGGTTLAKVPYPASTGATIQFKSAIASTANTAIYVDPTGSDTIDVTLIGCVRNF